MTTLLHREPVQTPMNGPGLRGEVDPEQPVTESRALGWLPHTCFLNGPPRRTGIELEQLVLSAALAAVPLPRPRHDTLVDDLRDLPIISALTVEPGGQLELSTPAEPDVVAAVAVLRGDLQRVRERAAWHGLRLKGFGLDPHRPPQRLRDTARYAAMEAYFGRSGRAGRLMMCSTASVQVCVEAGGDADDATGGLAHRWRLLHDVGPALVAAFANSPLHRGRPTGWMSSRQAIWAALDARRTRAPQIRAGETVTQAWAGWVLDAPLLLVRREHGPWTAPSGVTFRDWIRHGRAAVPGTAAPDLDDLAYHLTTLFPPVRARGHLEVRYLDAQPDDWWVVPVAVIAALVDDPAAGDHALDACAGVRGRWLDAARYGVHDADLRAAATAVLTAAAASLRVAAATADLSDQVEAYLDRWTLRGRSPADDLLDPAGAAVATGPVTVRVRDAEGALR